MSLRAEEVVGRRLLLGRKPSTLLTTAELLSNPSMSRLNPCSGAWLNYSGGTGNDFHQGRCITSAVLGARSPCNRPCCDSLGCVVRIHVCGPLLDSRSAVARFSMAVASLGSSVGDSSSTLCMALRSFDRDWRTHACTVHINRVLIHVMGILGPSAVSKEMRSNRRFLPDALRSQLRRVHRAAKPGR